MYNDIAVNCVTVYTLTDNSTIQYNKVYNVVAANMVTVYILTDNSSI